MKIVNVFKADWSSNEKSKLELAGINLDQYGIFQLTSETKTDWVLKNFSKALGFYHNRVRAIFSEQELKSSENLMLIGAGPNMVYPARLSNEDEGHDYLKYSFEKICPKFGTPLQEQIRPITLEKEPKLAKKYLWGSFHGISGYLFTDHERFKILEKKWGLNKKEVLIGVKQKVSKNFVQLDIPIASSPLCFGDSYFGRTLDLDKGAYSQKYSDCPFCNQPIYTNQILDYFPDFIESYNFDIVFTTEWFDSFRRTVVSKEFANWMIENRFIKYNSDYIIPVKDFCTDS